MSNVCLIIYTIDLPIYYKDKILNLRIIIVSIQIDNVIEKSTVKNLNSICSVIHQYLPAE